MSGRGRGKGPSRAHVAPEDGNPPPIGRIKRVADQGPPKVGTLPQPRGKGRKGRGRGSNERGGRGGRGGGRGGGTPNRGRGGAGNSRSSSPRGRSDRDRGSGSEFGRSRGRPRGGLAEGSSRSGGTSPVPYYGARSPSPRREWERRQESYRFDDRRHKAYSPSMPVDPAGPSSSSRGDSRLPPRRSPSPPRDQNHMRWASSPVPIPAPPPVAVRPPPPLRREVSPDRKPVVTVQPQSAPSAAAPPGPQPPKFRPRNHNQRQNLPVLQDTFRPVRPPASVPQSSGLPPSRPAVPLAPNPAPLPPPPSAPGWRTLPAEQPAEPSTRRSRSRNISFSRSPKQSHANLTEDIDIDIKPDIAALEKEQEERPISSSPPPRGPQTEGVAYFLRGEIPSQCFLSDKNARKVARDKFAQRQRAQLALEGKVAVPGGAKWRDDGFALDWRLSSPDDDVQIMPSLLSAPMGSSSTALSKKKAPALANQGQAGPSEASTKKRPKPKPDTTPKVTPTPPPQGGPLPYPAEAESGSHTRDFPANFNTPQSRQTDEFRRWRQAIVDSYRIRPDGTPNIVEAKVTLNGLNISWRPAFANEEGPLGAQSAPPDTVRASSGPASASGPSTRSASPGKRARDDSPASSEPARKRKAPAQSEPPARPPRVPRAPRPPVRPSRVRSPELIDLSGPVAASAPAPVASGAPFGNASVPQILSEDTPSTSYRVLSTSPPPGSSSSATSASPRRGFAQAHPLPTPISPHLGSGSQAPQLPPSSDPPAPVLVGADRLTDMQRQMDSLFDRIDRWTRLVQDFPQREPSLRKQIERTEDAIFNLQNEIDAEKEKMGM